MEFSLVFRFNLNKLNDRVKSNFVLWSHIGLQLWKIWTLRWKLIVPGVLLESV
jgi:hypothetical protein